MVYEQSMTAGGCGRWRTISGWGRSRGAGLSVPGECAQIRGLAVCGPL